MKFESPPPAHRARYDWNQIAAELRAKPGEWALLAKGERASIAVALRTGSIKTLHPTLGFHVTTRHNRHAGKSRTCDIYLCWADPSSDSVVTAETPQHCTDHTDRTFVSRRGLVQHLVRTHGLSYEQAYEIAYSEGQP